MGFSHDTPDERQLAQMQALIDAITAILEEQT